MKNFYMTDNEYEKCFVEFWGIRTNIANSLVAYGLDSGVNVLDILAGHGFLSYEIARIVQVGQIHAIGLKNDLESFQEFSGSLLKKPDRSPLSLIHYHVMNATQLIFLSNRFDFVVNFLGLEDLNMTVGKEGVKQGLSEFIRVLKPGGIILLTLCLEGDRPDEVLAKKISRYIGHNAFFYPKDFYIKTLESFGIRILEEKWYYTERKMTATQAREELHFACDETPRIFHDYHIQTVTFMDLWKKFGRRIETHGVAYYSDLCVLIGEKYST